MKFSNLAVRDIIMLPKRNSEYVLSSSVVLRIVRSTRGASTK